MCPRTDRLPKANRRVRGRKLSQTSPCVSRFPPFAGDCRKQILFPNWGKYISSGGPNLGASIFAGKEHPLWVDNTSEHHEISELHGSPRYTVLQPSIYAPVLPRR